MPARSAKSIEDYLAGSVENYFMSSVSKQLEAQIEFGRLAKR
jgi:hypothetical protein